MHNSNIFPFTIPPIIIITIYHFLKKSIKLEEALINLLVLGTSVPILIICTNYDFNF
ncbi:MAG: hypothetical protein APG12_00241 [Candidatus Methanofastidiosum methylothiophilum]|uniref:Uncharacterized protein n=1 Tax=Candidatus Methanofastidiosum methylothiophilum TaxID=1705564 RepID=A0A150IJM0_9EURY|nr:MAG: hypothetical protein APG10_01128 [Candidatus Methanofastidiosum methylthiophilus]KYC48680.1 MAG: hypothetical protein APG11_00190 [Candidatus Methanofastidiosum methylthiophilus]KYC51115.1 MAG: hypothetical protein APG12_00241 [Candidatus Methanofastidiosum methylthiophilus]